MSWRGHHPATLVYVEAIDEGDPVKEVDYRDAVYQVKAPFNATPQLILKTRQRFSGIDWGTETLAIAYDYWWNTRNLKTYMFNPADASETPVIIEDRNYQDVYSDPGSFVTNKNKFGRYTLEMNGSKLYLMGDGYTKDGQFPFIDEFNTKTKTTKRIYQSEYTDKIETLSSA